MLLGIVKIAAAYRLVIYLYFLKRNCKTLQRAAVSNPYSCLTP
jgi:hypothetical protein